jgi:hypothetical protein
MSQSNACRVNPCVNGATCQSLSDSSYRCLCRAGFSGVRCELVISNQLSPIYTIVKKNSITCQGSPTTFTATTCPSNLCLNGGSCLSIPGGGYRCSCQPAFTGSRCDIPAGWYFCGCTMRKRLFHSFSHAWPLYCEYLSCQSMFERWIVSGSTRWRLQMYLPSRLHRCSL